MSTRRVLPHEIRELRERLPRWLEPFTNWSAKFAVRGPRWVPRPIRWLPLHFSAGVMVLYVRGWL